MTNTTGEHEQSRVTTMDPQTRQTDTPAEHPADALHAAVRRCGAPVCVGLDPVASRLPTRLLPSDEQGEAAASDRAAAELAAIRRWTEGVLHAIAPSVPCVKLQSACWERYGADGVAARDEAIRAARQLGMVVILDAKRGDIGISAAHYAHAMTGAVAPSPAAQPQWVTINAYLGADGIEPFLGPTTGAFALVRTSNPGGDALQTLRLADGRTVADAVAQIVASCGRDHLGACGYSALGAVVGATKPDDAARLRALMPEQLFLVPGYGAQGGTLESVRPCFDGRGFGAVVTASRSVIYAGDRNDPKWPAAIGASASALAEEVGGAFGGP